MIIGGGVIGLSIARELVRSGVKKITVADRGPIGGEASFAAAGMLAPNAECWEIDDFYRLCDESRKMYPNFAAALRSETGIDVELDRSGTLFLAFSDEDSDHLSARFERQTAAGIPVQRLSRTDTLLVEPTLAPNVRESLYFPYDWQVENRKLLDALKTFAARNEIRIITERLVDSLTVESGRVRGAESGPERFSADITILATGAWTSHIKIGDVPIPVSVKPVRGQMISFRLPERQLHRVIYSPRGYLVPRADGRILAGATVEDVGFDRGVTDGAVKGLTHSAIEMVPALGKFPISETWAGLRPFAADGLPVIGEIDGLNGLLIATAHYRNGILLAPLTARLLADRITNGRMSRYLQVFSPRRIIECGLNANA